MRIGKRARRGRRCRRTPPASSPSLRGRLSGGRAIWTVRGLRGGQGVLRRVRVVAGAVRELRGVAATGEASRGQPLVRAFSRRAGVGPEAAGALSWAPPGGCNGRDLDGRTDVVDDLFAVVLRVGGDAHRGAIAP